MSVDNPPPVAERPPDSNPEPKVESGREAQDRTYKETEETATTTLRDEAVADGLMAGMPGTGSAVDAESGLTNQQRGIGTEAGRNPFEMTEGQRAAMGFVERNGVVYGPDGKPIDGTPKGEDNPENPALAVGENGQPCVNCENDTGVRRFDGTEGEEVEQRPYITEEDLAALLGEEDNQEGDARPGHRPGEAVANAHDSPQGDTANQLTATEAEVYALNGTADDTSNPPPVRPAGSEVVTNNDRSVAGGTVAPTLAGAGPTVERGSESGRVGDSLPPRPGEDTAARQRSPLQQGTTAESQQLTKEPEVTRGENGEVTGVRNADGTTMTNAEMRERLGRDYAADQPGGQALDRMLAGLSPEQQAKTLANMVELQNRMAGGDAAQRQQFNRDMTTFMQRGDITAQQQADAIGQLAGISRHDYMRDNNFRSGMSDANLRNAIAGGMDTIARPSDVDQARIGADGRRADAGTGQCNGTTIVEGLARENPEIFAARLRETALHGTYTGNDGFRAVMPSTLMTPNRQQNFADSLVIGGQLNHYHQQRGQYFSAWDSGNGGFTEARYAFDSSKVGNGNPFTSNYIGEGAAVGANEVAFMGINAGIDRGASGNAPIVFARPEWLPRDAQGNLIVGPGVAVVNSVQELQAARLQRYNDVNRGGPPERGTWGVAVNWGGAGGHVFSSYMDINARDANGNLTGAGSFVSDQYNNDRHMSDELLFAKMGMPGRSPGVPPGGVPDRPGEGGGGRDARPGVETPDERKAREEKEKDGPKKEEDDPHKNERKTDSPPELAAIRSQYNTALANLARATAEINGVLARDGSDMSGLYGEYARWNSDVVRLSGRMADIA